MNWLADLGSSNGVLERTPGPQPMLLRDGEILIGDFRFLFHRPSKVALW
jgi:hypothetical protein